MQNLWVNYNYDRDGLLTRLSFGNRILNYSNSPANGLLTAASVSSLSESWAYNGFAEPVAYQMRVSGSPRLGFAYTRDRLGRITAITETTPAGSQNTAYQYDLAGRLVQVMQEGEVVAQYAYDDNSNRISAQYSGHLAAALGVCAPARGVITAQVDAQDRLLSYGTCSYAYGANGELQSKTDNGEITSYQYDEFGNLRQVTLPDGRELSYAIDGLNRRIGKYIDGQLQGAWLYKDQLNPVAELDANGNVVSIFAYGEKSHVPSLMHKAGRTYRFITDHLGSVREVIDAENGQVAQALRYDAWGHVLQDSNPGFQPFGYAGGLYDRDTGLIRFGARDYDPVTGRWTAKDPIGFGGGDSNVYAYVGGDPVNFIDPFGLLKIRAYVSRAGGWGNEWRYTFEFDPISPKDIGSAATRVGRYFNRIDTAIRLLMPEAAGPNRPYKDYFECAYLDVKLQDVYRASGYRDGQHLNRDEALDLLNSMYYGFSQMRKLYDPPEKMISAAESMGKDHIINSLYDQAHPGEL